MHVPLALCAVLIAFWAARGRLICQGCILISGQELGWYQRTKRDKGGSREAMLADSRRRNGSVGDVLRKQRDQGLSV